MTLTGDGSNYTRMRIRYVITIVLLVVHSEQPSGSQLRDFATFKTSVVDTGLY